MPTEFFVLFAVLEGGWGGNQTSTWAPPVHDGSPGSDRYNTSGSSSSLTTDSRRSAPTADRGGSMMRKAGGALNPSAAVEGTNDASSGIPDAWFMERVYVMLKDSKANGVVKDINSDGSGTIELEDKTLVTVRSSAVALVRPKEHDMVLVTGGTDVGVEGELVCIDGSDAILKDANEDFKIVDLEHLAKIKIDE